MRVQVEDAEINDVDVEKDSTDVISLQHTTLTHTRYSEYHSHEYCHSPIPPPKSKVGGYMGMREGE